MKIKNIFMTSMLVGALLLTSIGIAQEKEKKTYGMVNLEYMMPKIGMEKAFVKAITEHNNLYHKEGPYKANLDNIITGEESGWYVWYMGPNMYSDLDNSPGEGAHTDHWTKNVAPTVAKYGRSEYWRYNDKLSYSSNNEPNKYETIWFLDINRGDYYRFKAFMTKVKEAMEKKGDGNVAVYNNEFSESNGRDVAIVWPFKNWAELDEDDEGIKKTYEEINGEGSWENAMDEWQEFVASRTSQVWETGIK